MNSYSKKLSHSVKKLSVLLVSTVLVVVSNYAIGCGGEKLGQTIYKHAFGRGCGACHDIATYPQLPTLIKEGKLSRETFEKVLREGKNGMPQAMDAIMGLRVVTSCGGLTEQIVIDELYNYLKTVGNGDVYQQKVDLCDPVAGK